jgi:diguanylate cyclase (GGDEF)-like protein
MPMYPHAMRFTRPPLMSSLLVPALVLALGIGAIASITALQNEAHDSARAQLQLAQAASALHELQVAPFRATGFLGGSPALARGLMDHREGQVNRTMKELNRSSPPAVLRRLAAPLRRNYATLERLYVIGVKTQFADKQTPLLAARAFQQMAQILAVIKLADRAYGQRTRTADSRATTGTAAVILLLVAGFALLYRRSVKARTFAERLVVENGRLLDASRVEALTDSLTALPNRRSLRRDLDAIFEGPADGPAHLLALFDLDGFKQYNDTFGHPAGDVLLTRLGAQLSAAVAGRGTAYRMGGDEFCVLAPVGPGGAAELVQLAAEALSEAGEAFDIGCSFGHAALRGEAATAEAALRLADQRMYEQKAGRASPTRQSTDVLLTVLSERSPNLHDHLGSVAALAETMSRALGLAEVDIEWIRIAAELHDVGKVAIPDAILNKPGPLDDDEWAFMRRHTVIGERIIRSAPSLAPAAQLVRSSHERHDGGGYPDGLGGAEIEVGARIIAVCDAYDAMVKHRVYCDPRSQAEALAELHRCAGTQFDPAIVELFCSEMQQRDQRLADARIH